MMYVRNMIHVTHLYDMYTVMKPSPSRSASIANHAGAPRAHIYNKEKKEIFLQILYILQERRLT